MSLRLSKILWFWIAKLKAKLLPMKHSLDHSCKPYYQASSQLILSDYCGSTVSCISRSKKISTKNLWIFQWRFVFTLSLYIFYRGIILKSRKITGYENKKIIAWLMDKFAKILTVSRFLVWKSQETLYS